VFMFESLTHWLHGHMLPCFYKKAFGVSCPMCGFQRSVIELLKGNFMESIHQFPALIPLLITVVVFLVLKFLHRPSLKVTIQALLLFDLAIMILTCVYKNIY
jgi:hypothetical protein